MMATSSVQFAAMWRGVAHVGSGHRIGACFEQCLDDRGVAAGFARTPWSGPRRPSSMACSVDPGSASARSRIVITRRSSASSRYWAAQCRGVLQDSSSLALGSAPVPSRASTTDFRSPRRL